MTPAEPTTAPAEKMVTVKIEKPNHEHNGEPCKVGDSVTVTTSQAKWLEDNKIGKRT